jgi:hypothetical protein
MTTRLDIIQLAFRRLQIVAEDEAITSDMEAYGGTILDSLYAEIAVESYPLWFLTDVPPASVHPLANLLAVEIAPAYGRAAPDTRGRAWRRLMATVRRSNIDEAVEKPDRGAERYY